MSTWARAKGWTHKIGAEGNGPRRSALGGGAVAAPLPAATDDWQPTTFQDLAIRTRLVQDRVATLLGSLAQDVSESVETNLNIIKHRVGESSDVIFRRFEIVGNPPLQAGLVYVEGLADTDVLNSRVLGALMMVRGRATDIRTGSSERLVDQIERHLLTVTQVKEAGSFDKLFEPLLGGDTVLFVQGCSVAFLIGMRQFAHRSVEEPSTEAVIRGPREGFIESLRTNTSLIRRKIRDPNLRILNMHLGTKTKTEIAICYLQDVAQPDLVREVERRLWAIDIDAILESGYIEQFLEDNHYSPFPQVLNTERPDKVAANLLDGRVAILTDGSPFALVVPAVFNQFYQTVEDYYERYLIGILIRSVRLVALLFSLIIPSVYVSLVSFNPEMIPTKFAVAVAGGRAGIPVPAFVEVAALEIVMEILREASLRLPKQIGGAISIVGVLVIGQAAVSSGFVSPITVVIVAIGAIGSFATPAFNAAIALRLLRFPILALAGTFGLYGVLVGLILIVNHMLSLESFGVPYMAPVAPLHWQGLMDTFVRAPIWLERKRPRSLKPLDRTRMANRYADVYDAKRPVLDPAHGQGGEAP